MTPELADARQKRGLPPYRHDTPTWKQWTTEEVALAAGTTEGAISQRAKRGHFPGAVRVKYEQGHRWMIPDESARAFIARARSTDGRVYWRSA